MSEAGALLQSVLGEFAPTAEQAVLHLEAALELEVDPLDYCAHRFELGETVVMERAAAWAGLEFFPAVPATTSGRRTIERIERLGEVRSIQVPLLDREIVYSAPTFEKFLQLKLLHEIRPDLRSMIAIVPLSAIRAELATLAEESMMDAAQHRMVRRWPRAAGQADAPRSARIGFVVALAVLLVAVTLAPWVHAALFLPVVGIVLLVPALLRMAAAVSRPPPSRPVPQLPHSDLPVYTVLVPLRDEADMVGQLAEALKRIDYPPEKLDVLFVVETRSLSTVAAVQMELADPRFELVLVPDAMPRTKPKALNYALPLVRGEHVVVYDAEDIPEPGQLRLAASTFAVHPELMCLQAELVIDNAGEGTLAALFAGEYAGQFGLMLPLLARLDLPMPLGGTSNHFRTEALRQVGGWDAFNVTEDADLGVRLARMKLKTATIGSRTGEEAPISAGAWLRQRSRWMKGWMQTLIVHDRHWRSLLRDLGWPGFIGLHVYVGSMIFSAPLHAAFLLSVLTSAMTLRLPTTFDWSSMLTVGVFILGYLGPVLLVIAGLDRLQRLDLLAAQLLLPFYWLLHGLALLMAAWELVVSPFAWSKTKHGQTRMTRLAPRPTEVQAE